MTPILTIIIGFAAWLTGMAFAWAFVHGAQKLRRQEVAAMMSRGPDKAGHDSGQSAVSSITPEAEQLRAVA
jgi:hypothetical protein